MLHSQPCRHRVLAQQGPFLNRFVVLSCRMVDRQQVLLNYEQGGMPNHVWKWLPSLRPKKPGFENCIGIRYRDLKWIGVTNTVYR